MTSLGLHQDADASDRQPRLCGSGRQRMSRPAQVARLIFIYLSVALVSCREVSVPSPSSTCAVTEQFTYGMEGQGDQLICGLRKYMMTHQCRACNERCIPTRDRCRFNDAAVDIWMASGQLLPKRGKECLWAKPILLYTFSREASALTPASNCVDRSIAFVSPSVSKQENACEQIHLGNVLECL